MKHTTQFIAGSLSLAVLILAAAPQARAASIAFDTFNYPDGTNLGGQNGGAGTWTSAWSNVAPGVATDWVVSNGIAQTTPGTDGGSDRYARRGVTVPNYTTTPYYFRFDYTLPTLGGGEGSIFGGLSIGQSATLGANDLSIYSQPLSPQEFRVDLAAGPTMSIFTNLAYDTKYTIVTRLEPNDPSVGPGQSRLTIWLSSNDIPFAATDTPVFQTTMNTVITPSFVSLFRQSQTSTSVLYDNVSLGTTFGDVVPEPTAMTLMMGLGLVGFVVRRRRF
jgi:hypothetical protein